MNSIVNVCFMGNEAQIFNQTSSTAFQFVYMAPDGCSPSYSSKVHHELL